MAVGRAAMAHHGVRELARAFARPQSGGKPPHSKGARVGDDAIWMSVSRGSLWPKTVTDRVVHTIRFPLYDGAMSPLDQKAQTGSSASQRFRTTRWSIVLAAGRRSSPESHDALATLCQIYWYPLYAYVRRKGHALDDAQDLTQEFLRDCSRRTSPATRTAQRQVSIVSARLTQSFPDQRMARRQRTEARGRPSRSLARSDGRREPIHARAGARAFRGEDLRAPLGVDPDRRGTREVA